MFYQGGDIDCVDKDWPGAVVSYIYFTDDAQGVDENNPLWDYNGLFLVLGQARKKKIMTESDVVISSSQLESELSSVQLAD